MGNFYWYNNKKINIYVNEGIIYPEIKNNPNNIYSFLLYTGYLTANKKNDGYELFIPNNEIRNTFKKEILDGLQKIIPSNSLFIIENALISKNIDSLKENIGKFLKNSISYYDGSNEAFYHGITLGMLVLFDDLFYITSNRESGYGRYDILLEPKEKDLFSIIIEVKNTNDINELPSLANGALKQIQTNEYHQTLNNKGINNILMLGVAYCGKEVEIVKFEEH